MKTVDVVIEGAGHRAIAATLDAARRGERVLVVCRARGSRFARQLRQVLRAAGLPSRQVAILPGTEVACVAGVNGIEAVVIRHLGRKRLSAFNATHVLRVSRSPKVSGTWSPGPESVDRPAARRPA